MTPQTHKQKPRNIKEFSDTLETPRVEFYRVLRARLGVSLVTAERWCKLDSQTTDPEKLATLAEITNIPIDNIFKRFDDENPA